MSKQKAIDAYRKNARNKETERLIAYWTEIKTRAELDMKCDIGSISKAGRYNYIKAKTALKQLEQSKEK